jgi:peptidoglycan-N-acetylglucosamine deacetylase
VRSHPGIVQRMAAEGHEIANHSTTHRVMTKLSDAEVLEDFRKCHDAIVSTSGQPPRLQRPPYGSMTQRQRAMLHARYGYRCILWDVDPLDWKKPGSGVVAQRVISAAKNGSILLLHDIHQGSVESVPQILDTLIGQGYTFVTVSQLLAMGGN